MTVAKLIEILSTHADELEVRFEYDGGYSYPEVERVFTYTAELGGGAERTFVCLAEKE